MKNGRALRQTLTFQNLRTKYKTIQCPKTETKAPEKTIHNEPNRSNSSQIGKCEITGNNSQTF